MKNLVQLSALILLAALLSGCASTAENEKDAQKERKLLATHIDLAASYLQRGQLEYAMENASKALAIDSHSPPANNMMALIQWRMRDVKEAERYFEKSLRTDPDNPDTHNNFGVFLCEKNEIDKALKHFDAALAQPLYRTPAQANLNAGLCLLKRGDAKKAEIYIKAALDIAPAIPAALFNMAKIRFDSGSMMSARAYMQRYFASTKDKTPESLLLAIGIERALGAKDAEASYAMELRNKFPDSPQAKAIPR